MGSDLARKLSQKYSQYWQALNLRRGQFALSHHYIVWLAAKKAYPDCKTGITKLAKMNLTSKFG